jgi:hypothetical protein
MTLLRDLMLADLEGGFGDRAWWSRGKRSSVCTTCAAPGRSGVTKSGIGRERIALLGSRRWITLAITVMALSLPVPLAIGCSSIADDDESRR